MVKFNNAKFSQIIDIIVKSQGFFCGRRISSKTQLYTVLGEKLNQSPETVRGWRKTTSAGPNSRDPEVLKDLEKILGLNEGDLLIETNESQIEDTIKDLVEKENKKMGNNNAMINIKVTDFQKSQIMECYEAMKELVSNMDIEDEDAYCNLRYSIEAKKIALPSAIHQSIMDFLDNVVESYVYCDHHAEFTPDEAEYTKDGTLHLKTEAATQKQIASFMEQLMALDDEIESFAEKELKKYLIN